jgi:XRE family transcriptional regulator, fatty acid utilization regulator
MMSGSKIFAGARLRRMRNKLNLNQAALAQSLGISPSYLNLIERDQRPITAQLLLKLHTLHGADIAELSGSDEHSDVLASLKEVVADPLLSGEIPVATELVQAQEVAPNLVGATIKLYSAYREVLRRLSDISQQLEVGGAAPTETVFESVQTWLQENPLYQSFENLAEEIWFDLTPKDDVFAGIKARLRSGSGIDVRIIPIDIMGSDRARYDRHSQRLFISERLNAHEKLFEAALLLASLEGAAAIDEIVQTSSFANNAEASRLLRLGLTKNLATAILCPPAKFKSATVDLNWNIEALSDRFNVSTGMMMKRLACLSLRDESDLPIGFLAIDSAGAIFDRLGPLRFHLPIAAKLCGHLPHFTGESAVELETADGQTTGMLARRVGHITYALCFSSVHGAKINFTSHAKRPLGSTCRLCEIKSCTLRREPQATRPAALNPHKRGATDFESE